MRLEVILASHARRRPDHPAIVCGERRLSYRELYESSRRLAAGLAKLGVTAGDRVVVRLPSGVEFVETAYAVWMLGATLVPANTRLAPPEIAHIIADSSPRIVIDEASFAQIPTAIGEPQTVAAPSEDCIVLYTSGTTGAPKGAINTHNNMVTQNVYMHALAWDIRENDRVLVATPMAHRAGVARLINALGLGGTLVVVTKFDAETVLQAMEREKVTVAGLIPTILRLTLPELRKSPARCASLRCVIVGAEAFPAALRDELIAVLPRVRPYTVFGMSEALVSTIGPGEMEARPDSVGRPFPGIEVRIVDDRYRDVTPGEIGELLVRGGAPGQSVVMKGYLNRSEGFHDGWYCTGDLARADAEGFLYIVDRKKDMVLTGGYNVYSREVEQTIAAHPSVADAAVLGLPDLVFGESVAAFVELKPGARLTADELIEHCRTRLAGYKKPKHVVFVERLPRNSAGKILKNELRARA